MQKTHLAPTIFIDEVFGTRVYVPVLMRALNSSTIVALHLTFLAA
jgi:hypothetical protein